MYANWTHFSGKRRKSVTQDIFSPSYSTKRRFGKLFPNRRLKPENARCFHACCHSVMISSAARRPSIAAETIPPAYPAPSPTGYTPGCVRDCPFSFRNIRKGALVRDSMAVSTASSPSYPLICLPNALSPSRKAAEANSGRHLPRSAPTTPGRKVGSTSRKAFVFCPRRKSPNRQAGASPWPPPKVQAASSSRC